ncbi:TetR/AcrR family transcriptional regulator [Streptomyces cocklensis]|jgi:AcrR family transcriptional regulator|nr:TetR/AcrR family transcriptional regulator [Actinacidiphila cocklensis]MDD1057006.1 TetR/AcrR family transcriptional regulator [Actinacidiphila cocklensis]WSX78158.1 TetR/AcrR family transcriptional regulator [Streptomyces sp. NBC_00899]
MSTARGQRRAFDRDEALETAMTEFWRYGYEATSVAALTQAMGINPPSLYAAFGNKRQLFSEAVARYAGTHGSYGARALAEPTARAAVERLLRLAAAAYTEPGRPPGCLVINGATNCTPASEDVKAELREWRDGTKRALERKIDADVASGLLPPGTDAMALATFYAAVVQGMCTQACDGVGRAELDRTADVALAAWPG